MENEMSESGPMQTHSMTPITQVIDSSVEVMYYKKMNDKLVAMLEDCRLYIVRTTPLSVRETGGREAVLLSESAALLDEVKGKGKSEKVKYNWEEECLQWRNMVAVLCRDGGHYHADHGTVKTTEYILERVTRRRVLTDKLVEVCEAAKMRLLKIKVAWEIHDWDEIKAIVPEIAMLEAVIAEAKEGVE